MFNVESLQLNKITSDVKMRICKRGYEDLEDNPETHRWRANWLYNYQSYNPIIIGIELNAYQVIKKTRCGAWINRYGYRHAITQEWVPFEERCMKKQFVHDGSMQAWAKPTQEEAVKSLAIRLCRWAQCINKDMQRVKAAIEVLETLRPDYKGYACTARGCLSVD